MENLKNFLKNIFFFSKLLFGSPLNLKDLNNLHENILLIKKLRKHELNRFAQTYELLYTADSDNKIRISSSKIEKSFFSQNGEDGILSEIVSKIGKGDSLFVELGSGGFSSNAILFWSIFNWDIVQIDGSEKALNEIKKRCNEISKLFSSNLKKIYYLNTFVEPDNINNIIPEKFLKKEITIFSIDIDGNDFWILKELSLKPRIIIAEYNSFFGNDESLTIPYTKNFQRRKFDKKGIYYGASLKAIKKSVKDKYIFLGVENNGINCFFVRKDLYNKELKKIPLQKFCHNKNLMAENPSLNIKEHLLNFKLTKV
jgi:hypothetical protein